jgi:hypothetical protein
MANAYSAPLNYGHAIDTNEQAKYIASVQGAMQQKFDVNLAKIDDLIAKVSSVPLARDKDKRYLGDKLQGLLSMVDANSKVDLTDNVVARQITNYIGGAIDDEVKTQISNSQKIYSYNAELDEIKSKKPGEYNSANDAYAMYKSGLSDYMSGKRDDLGRLQYTPYTDVNKETLEELTKLKALKGDQVIEMPDGAGRLRKTTLNGLSADEIYQYMPQLLSSKVLNQLDINGWAKVKNNMPEAKLNFEKAKQSRLEALDLDISQYEAAANNSLKTPAEQQEAKALLEKKKAERIDSEDLFKTMDVDNPEQLGSFLERNSYKYSIARIASGRQSIEYKKDDYYFAQRELELAEKKDAREERESLTKAGLGADGKPLAGADAGYVGSEKVSTDLPESPEFYSQIKTDHNKEYNTIVQSINGAYSANETTDDQRKEFTALLSKKGYQLKNGKISAIPGKENIAKGFSSATAAIEAFNTSRMNITQADAAMEITKADAKRMSLMGNIVEAEKKGYTETFNKDADKYIEQLKEASEATNDPNFTDKVYGAFSNPMNTVGKAAAGAGAGAAVSGLATAATGLGAPLTPVTATAGAIIGGIGGAFIAGGENRTVHENDLKVTGNKITKFVNDNGGWKNLKTNIKGDINKIKQLADLTREAVNKSAGLYEGTALNWGDKILDTEAKQSAGNYLKTKNSTAGGAYFTTGREYNITSEAERTKISNLLSQTNQEQSAMFDPKSAYTASMSGDNIILTQKKGLKSTGGVEYQATPAKITLEKGDAAYAQIARSIEVSRGQEGLNATVAGPKTVIKPYVAPNFLSPANEFVLEKADNSMANIPASMQKELLAHPANYLTETRTKDIFEQKLTGILPKEDIDYLVQNISDNLSDFSLEVKPMDNVWGAEIKNKTNGVLIRNGKFSNNDQALNTDMLNLAKNYPQVIITDSILRYIIKNPKGAKTIFN